MIYEMRTYHVTPGKMSALHNRFSQWALPLFKKHGFSPIGFWTTHIGWDNNLLFYVLEWPDLQTREQGWQRFSSDPEWIEAKKASEVDGPLVERIENCIMAATQYSPGRV
jgi:hypothetical protein